MGGKGYATLTIMGGRRSKGYATLTIMRGKQGLCYTDNHGGGGARVTLHWQSWGSKGYATLTLQSWGSKSYATLTIMGGARVTLHWQSWGSKGYTTLTIMGGGTRVTLHWQSQCLWPDPNPDTASPAFLEQPSHWTVHGCWGHSGGSWPWPRSACGQETR